MSPLKEVISMVEGAKFVAVLVILTAIRGVFKRMGVLGP
jgi:hypothetical protein